MRSLPSRLSLARASLVLLSGAALSAALPASSSSLSASPTGSLESALNAISTDQIRKDIFHIASDEMAGRDTPSEGLRATARYIAERLEKLKFEPGAQKGYFYEYPLFLPHLELEKTHLVFERGSKKSEFHFGEDYYFVARRLSSGELAGPIVYCGRGADADFGAQVAGAWALVLDEGQGALGVEKNARQFGALGLLYTPGKAYTGKPYAERFASQVTAAKSAPVQWPSKRAAKPGDEAADASSEKKKDLQVVYLMRETAEKLCSLDKLERLDEGAAKPEIEGRLSDTRKLLGDDGLVTLENVCGFWRGSDPELSKEVLIVSAHYDHVGTDSKGVVYNGADDNGSGTTGLLALAQALAKHGPMRRSVMLLWVSGEEKGLFGSQAWTENPWLPEGCKPVCDINIDMIGRNAADYLLITPTASRKEYNGLVKLAEANAPREGFPKLGSCDSYWSRSDHANFASNLKIPVTFLFSDVHEDYHKPGDDPDKIDCDKIRRVTRLVMRMLDGLQADKLEL